MLKFDANCVFDLRHFGSGKVRRAVAFCMVGDQRAVGFFTTVFRDEEAG